MIDAAIPGDMLSPGIFRDMIDICKANLILGHRKPGWVTMTFFCSRDYREVQ